MSSEEVQEVLWWRINESTGSIRPVRVKRVYGAPRGKSRVEYVLNGLVKTAPRDNFAETHEEALELLVAQLERQKSDLLKRLSIVEARLSRVLLAARST